MATRLAITLSEKSPEWDMVFKLQTISDFVAARESLASVHCMEENVRIYSDLVRIQLELCVSVSAGSMPKEEYASQIRAIVAQSVTAGCMDVQIEALLLMFDVFTIYREEAYTGLVSLETSMDSHTLRRWFHRKGLRYMQLGNLQEALDLWLPLVTDRGDTLEDLDDSLSCLLLDFGRVCSHLGKYSEAVDVYNQSLCVCKTSHNQGLSLIRLSNALERIARPAQADKRRIEYFALVQREYPTNCSLCSGSFGKEPKFLIPCCKTIVHSECLRAEVSDLHENETNCPFCKVKFFIGDIVVDPSNISGRKYVKKNRSSNKEEVHGEEEHYSGSDDIAYMHFLLF